jgi:hypothetical protein
MYADIEVRRQKARDYAAAHRDIQKARSKQWRLNNPGKSTENSRKWRLNNPEKYAENSRKEREIWAQKKLAKQLQVE